MIVEHIKSSFDRKFDLTDVLPPDQYYEQFKPHVQEMFVKTQYGQIHTYVAGQNNKIPIIAMHVDGTGLNYLNWL